MGIQGNNPHNFLWHLYDQKFKKKKKLFSTQPIINLVRIKKCPLNPKLQTNPHSRNTHFLTTF